MDIPTTSYEDLLKELECPVCYTYISPPIRQCINVHSICDSCFERVDICPVCRQEKNPKRNSVLERLYQIIQIPCQYEECNHKAKGSLIKDHESKCLYRPSLCPLSILKTCQWTGPMSQIKDHCRKEHQGQVVLGAEALLVNQNVRHCTVSNKYMTLFYVFDTVFRVYWDMSANSGAVKFSVTYKGNPEEVDRFSYRIRFIRPHGSRVARSLFGKCANVGDATLLSTPGSIVGANYNSIKDFCTVGGDLEFFIRISDNNSEEAVDLAVAGGKRKLSTAE